MYPAGSVTYTIPSVSSPVQSSLGFDGFEASVKWPLMYFGDMNGVLHWCDATTGGSTWITDSSGTEQSSSYSGYQTQGALFSSPNITDFNIPVGPPQVASSYIYTGCADGRVYALSCNAWGGQWAGGVWPFSGSIPNSNAYQVSSSASSADVQFELITPQAYQQCTSAVNPDGAQMTNTAGAAVTDSNGNAYYSAVSSAGTAVCPFVSTLTGPTSMVLPTGLSNATQATINQQLMLGAQQTRLGQYIFDLSQRISEANNNSIYFEWGQKIYMILWNLPPTSVGSIVLNMANTSGGSGAGSTVSISGTISSRINYYVLNADDPIDSGGGDDQILPVLTCPSSGGSGVSSIQRSYALAQIYIQANTSNPPTPGPGWVITAQVPDSSGGTVIIPIAQLQPLSGTAGAYTPVTTAVNSAAGAVGSAPTPSMSKRAGSLSRS